MVRWTLRVFLFFAFLFGFYSVLRTAHSLWPKETIAPEFENVLRKEGELAIRTGDVPVAAILVHNGRIIGKGHNTVLRDNNAGGHAEVNAVSNAMALIGREEFRSLDRDSLVLISTFEPCALCRGMICEYRIKRVIYNEPRSLLHWMKEDLRWMRYELTKRIGGQDGLQETLFRMHPEYSK